MGVRFVVRDGSREIGVVETATEDDFMYFRDSVHEALETGEFGNRFPTFMQRFFENWDRDEIAALEKELIEIDAELRKLAPNPPDLNWSSKLAISGARPETLADVFLDKDDKPLLACLISLAAMARKRRLGVNWES
ncbi:MAG: Imm70 family immunity protein [Hyphomonadaceae bacterium]